MPFFHKKPVVIEAIQWTGENLEELNKFTHSLFALFSTEAPVESFAGDMSRDGSRPTAQVYDVLHETWVLLHTNDWIIKGVKGEFYPCRSDVFAETYELHNFITME